MASGTIWAQGIKLGTGAGATTAYNLVSTADYTIDKVGSTYYARPGIGTGLTAYSNADAYTVIQAAINALTVAGAEGTGGGSIFIKAGSYVLTNELQIIGWTGSGISPSGSQIKIEGAGRNTKILQAISGKNALLIKNNASVILRNLWIECNDQNARSAIKLDAGGANSEVSVFGGIFENLYLTAYSATYPALYMQNFMDIVANYIYAVNTIGDGVILENASSTILYGNSHFSFLKVVASASSPFAGLKMQATRPDLYKVINLMSFDNFECVVNAYYGVHIVDGRSNTFLHVDIENVTVGFYVEGTNIASYNNVLGGYIFTKSAGTACIKAGTSGGGNSFACLLEGGANTIPILDQIGDWLTPNSYDVVISDSPMNTDNISISYLSHTYLKYRSVQLKVTRTNLGNNEVVTATADGLTTGIIAPGSQNLTVTSNTNDVYIISLPAASAGTIGTKITGLLVGAKICELRVRAAQHASVHINGVATDNVEAALPAACSFEVVQVDATHWILKAWTALGAVITAIVPDAV